MSNVIEKTDEFLEWIDGLRDQKGRARILNRIVSAEAGNFGDCAPVGDGVREMRIHFGPGYRVYYGQRGEVVYLLLAGGDKGSQKRDIEKAKTMWREVKGQKT